MDSRAGKLPYLLEFFQTPISDPAQLPAALRFEGLVYVIHFITRLGHAGHYIGWTNNLARRLKLHRSGRGARLMAVCGEQSIDWVLAAVFLGDKGLERELKAYHNGRKLCPICRAAYLAEQAGKQRARRARHKEPGRKEPA